MAPSLIFHERSASSGRSHVRKPGQIGAEARHKRLFTIACHASDSRLLLTPTRVKDPFEPQPSAQQGFANHSRMPLRPLTIRKSLCRKFVLRRSEGDPGMNGLAVMENVRRYRAIASLCRQAAAFRPIQQHSLLAQAEEWEHQAVSELEGYFQRLDS
jgi:hypothetical protein